MEFWWWVPFLSLSYRGQQAPRLQFCALLPAEEDVSQRERQEWVWEVWQRLLFISPANTQERLLCFPGLPMSTWCRKNLKDLQTALCRWRPPGSPTFAFSDSQQVSGWLFSLVHVLCVASHISKCSGLAFLKVPSLFTFQVNWLL